MNTEPQIEPVTDEDVLAAVNLPRRALEPQTKHILEQDRRRVVERQANHGTTHAEGCVSWGRGHYECAMVEIERLRAEVAQADADYNDAVTLAQMNLDLLKAAEAEVAALKAAGAQKDGALGICRAMLSVVHDFGQFTRSTKVAIGVAESALSTDAGKGWIDATGAVEVVVGTDDMGHYGVDCLVPDDWAGARVLIVRVP